MQGCKVARLQGCKIARYLTYEQTFGLPGLKVKFGRSKREAEKTEGKFGSITKTSYLCCRNDINTGYGRREEGTLRVSLL